MSKDRVARVYGEAMLRLLFQGGPETDRPGDTEEECRVQQDSSGGERGFTVQELEGPKGSESMLHGIRRCR